MRLIDADGLWMDIIRSMDYCDDILEFIEKQPTITTNKEKNMIEGKWITIDFKNGSSGSAADEQEDTLMLSPDVINRSMPVILCQEEDVDGRHGATIGQLGEDLLFYMQTRGIDEESAKRMMIRARLDSVARTIPDKELEQRVIFYIQNII